MKKTFLLLLAFITFLTQNISGQNVNVNDESSLNSAITGFNSGLVSQITLTNSITLTNALPILTGLGNLVIDGTAAHYTIQRDSSPLTPAFSIFNITAGNITIKDVDILNGSSGTNGGGINIIGASAIVTLDKVRIYNCQANNGGGIYNLGNLTVSYSTIDNNKAAGGGFYGGGIYNNGKLKLVYTTISGNQTLLGGTGGGIYHTPSTSNDFSLDHVTITNNSSSGLGDGIYIATGTVSTNFMITNSLLIGNASYDIYNNTGSPITLAPSNLVTAVAGASITGYTTEPNPSNVLRPLAGFGGATPTHALLGTATNAIDNSNVTGTPSTDQRGMPIKNIPDIGAYEFGTFWVTTDADEITNDATYSLREALTDANGGAGLPNTTTAGVPYREIKFRIPSVSPLCTLFNALPAVNKAMIIDGNTQLAYPSSTKVVLSGTGSFNGLSITPSAARTQVYGLVFRNFNTGIAIDANNVVIGDYVSSPPIIDRRNVFQSCGTGVTINGSYTKVNANYFGLQENGFDNSFANGTGYDIQIGGSATILGTTIGEFAKGNYLAAKNGGIMFSASSLLIRNTTIQYNNIGTDINLTTVINGGSTVGIHTNGNVDTLTIRNNLIVNRGSAGGIGIFLNDSSKNVTISNNQIGFSYSGTIPVPLPTYNGIQLRGGSLLPPTLGLSNNIVIANNMIGGNTNDGINIESRLFINNPSNNTVIIRNNLIGIDSAGNAVGNGAMGISASGQVTANGYLTVDNNIIANNGSTGLSIGGASKSVKITNNKIGVKSDGVTPAGNKSNGIVLTSSDTLPITQAIITDNIIANTSPIPPNTASVGMILGNVRDTTNIITGNIIKNNGTQGTGIYVTGGCTNLAIGKLSGTANTIIGQENGIQNLASGVTIQNNYIGTNSSSDTGLGNTANGIVMAAAGGIIQNNVVSGNGNGISLQTGADSISIDNNLIGLNTAGTAAIPNSIGIDIDTLIFGINIKNNSFAATFIGLVSNSPCVIDNNKFGTTHDGTAALSNFGNLALSQPTFSAQAISLTAGASGCTVKNNVICGARNNVNTTILGNTFSGSAEGILIAAGDMDINSNKIGITSDSISIPNDIGIRIQGTVNNCFIGNNPADGNIISNNKNAAIYINSSPAPAPASSVTINGNYIGTNISGATLSTVPTEVGIAAENNTNVGINGNVINNTKKMGIGLLSNPSPMNQIQNTIIGNLNPNTGFNTIAGISVGSGWTINSNTIENGDGVGVLLNGNFNTLSFDTIRNNKKQGVNIRIGANNRINQCSIYNNGTAPSFAEKGIDLNLGTTHQGNAGQIAPVLQSVTVTGSTVTSKVTVNIPVAGNYFLQFFKTTPANANNDIDQAEGEIYLGTVNQTFTSTGTQTITVSFTLLPPATVANTDFITATITSSIFSPTTILNSSEFSNALTPCPNKIVAITLANIDINCIGTTADVLIQYEDLQNPPTIGDLFDVDIDGNGTFDFTNISLETGNIIRLKTMSGGTTFSNTKVKPVSGTCVTPAFANTVTVPASRIPSPIITNVQAIQPTSCNPKNGQLIVTLGNGTAGETYEVSTVGTILGAGNFQNIVLSPNRTLTITGFKGGDKITPSVVVYRHSLSCTSNAFPFNFNYVAPINDIDSTLNIVADVDEISPNFPTKIVVEKTQDSIAYTLVNLRTGRQIGVEQIGKANTSVTFVTDTLFTDTDFAVYARSIRTGCSIKLTKTVTVKVISGILAEELDVLREVYTSTLGDNWLIKWDFTKDISTFHGVRVFGGRVYDIKLGGNNLAGRLTTRVNTLKRLATLEINNNQLDFGSVEPFVGKKYSFRYDTQAKIDRSIDTAVYENANLRLNVTTAGNFNRYQWQKDGVNVGGISSSPTLVLSPLKTSDAGVYTCFVTNTVGTALTLERRTIRLKVLKYPSTLDSLLLVRLNDALGGNNWKNKWDRSKPVSQWYGIEMDGDKVISLNLANNNLVGTIPDIIPPSNSILSDLTYLNLSGNLIGGALPKTLGNLTKLQYLDVSKNNLQGEVISELGNLRALKTLLLSFNNFSTIHPNIGTLAALENLFVNNNQLKELPTALSGLRALQKFDANYNLLQQFPANFSTWTNLTYLALSNNQITALSNNWSSFTNLQELYLQVNQLKDLPNTFTALRNLKTLYLHSNALDFADLEPLAVLPVLNTDGAVYEPQAKVGTPQEVVVALDQVISLTQAVNGTANTYEWWKDDRKIAGIAANQLNYLKYTVTFEDAGIYKLVIRNNIARRLALISQDIVVKVACGTSSSVQVGIAGNLQYCEGETYNTTLTAQVNAIKPIAYQWFRNNTRLAGEETATLKPVLEGSYTVQVRSEDGCMYISKAITFTTSPKPVATLRNVGDSLIVNILAKRGNEKIVWYRNGEQIANANGRTYKATTAGKYYAVVSDTTICQAKTQELSIAITSIDDDWVQNFQLYPNPTNDKVVLQTTLAVEKLVVQNNLGQTLPIIWVKDADKYSIDLKDLPTGVYYLSIYHSKGKIQQKLHKE
jgi:hypothetical protein